MEHFYCRFPSKCLRGGGFGAEVYIPQVQVFFPEGVPDFLQICHSFDQRFTEEQIIFGPDSPNNYFLSHFKGEHWWRIIFKDMLGNR